MCDFFPFHALNDLELVDELVLPNHKVKTLNRLSDQGLKNFILNLTKNDYFKSLDSMYLTLEQFNQKIKKVQNSLELSLFHLNIQSLNSKLSEFRLLIGLIDVDFDVIVLSEIWSTNIDFYSNILCNYSLHIDLPVGSRVGGVGIFVKKSLCVTCRHDLKLKSEEDNKIENIWLEVTKNTSKLIIGGIYRHPNQNVNNFSTLLEHNLAVISAGKSPCVVVGDINIDLIKSGSHTGTQEYLNNLLIHNFLPSLLLPTRITATSSTLIDHIYFYSGQKKKKEWAVSTGNLFYEISDHLPNFILLSKQSNKINYKDRPFIRLQTAKNKTKFSEYLNATDWNEVFGGSQDANHCYDQYLIALKSLYEKSFPLVRLSRRAMHDKKWFTTALKISCKKKNQLYKKWLQSKTAVDETNFKQYRNVFKAVAKKAEVEFYQKQFDKKTNSIKQLWRNFNNLITVKSAKNKCVINRLFTDHEITDPVEISTTLNTYFCNIGMDLSNKLPAATVKMSDYLHSPICNSIFVTPVTVNEIDSIINGLNSNKAYGEDGFSPGLIKEFKASLCHPLEYIFNLSLTTGTVPNSLKTAKVIPLFKKGDVCSMSNYRPISLLSIFNKILEKIVYVRLHQFLVKNKVLYKFQFGFRKHHSTALALIDVIDSCYKNIDSGNKVLGVFLDLQKAFDTVNHDILLHKLSYYGIRGVMHNWLKSYLIGRKQYTVVNGVSSEPCEIRCGVPQGSVLGPLLFLIYVNDISAVTGDSNLKLFADDTNLFVFAKTYVQLQQKANECLSNLQNWFLANKLSLNIEKTNFTIFASRNKNNERDSVKLSIGGQMIQRVNCCKYLGVFVDEQLCWEDHINYIYKKLVKFTSLFYKIRHLLPYACLKMLYYAFVHPHMQYCIEIYASACKVYLNKLRVLNNKLIRILFSKSIFTRVVNLYKCVNSLPVEDLYELQLLVMIHKCLYHKHLLPEVFHEYFINKQSVHLHNTRHPNDLFLARCNMSVGQKMTIYSGCKFWNLLPENLKVNCALTSFRKKVKCYLTNRMN